MAKSWHSTKEHAKIQKGAWTREEDLHLTKYIEKYGVGNWRHVPLQAGLRRCRKSCRLRWLNYLRPDIKRGKFEDDEVDLIIRLHKLLGNKWSLISGRIPGRTANDIKNYWNTHIKKRLAMKREKVENKKVNGNIESKKIAVASSSTVFKPQPRTIVWKPLWFNQFSSANKSSISTTSSDVVSHDLSIMEDQTQWWKSLPDNGGLSGSGVRDEEEEGMLGNFWEGEMEDVDAMEGVEWKDLFDNPDLFWGDI